MVREPLFHFLLFGLLIFAYFKVFPTNDDFISQEIIIGEAEIQRLKNSWEQSWRTPPNNEQMSNLLDNAIKEEIYYREGLRLGLDKHDPVVRNRMVQKMRFLHSEQIPEPSDADLQRILDAGARKYEGEVAASFRHIYLGQGASALSAQDIIDQLNSGAAISGDLGKPLNLPSQYLGASQKVISRDFGSDFAQTVTNTTSPKSSWFGPVFSGYGQHLVLITEIAIENRPSLDNPIFRKRLENDWRAEQGTLIEARIFQSLRENYSVRIRRSE